MAFKLKIFIPTFMNICMLANKAIQKLERPLAR